MSRHAIRLELSGADESELKLLLTGGVQQVRVTLRALALLRLHQGLTAPQVAQVVQLTDQAVRQIARRYRAGGLERALYEGPRPGKGRVLDQTQRQKIVAMVCGSPPAGQSRWTVRLIVEQAQRKKLVPRVGRETIRMLLQDHDLKPWREKNVVRSGGGTNVAEQPTSSAR
jgi:putative transposase